MTSRASWRPWLCLQLAALLLLVPAVPAAAAPSAERWPLWEKHDPGSTQTIDMRTWGRFLKSYLKRDEDGINRIAYGSVTPQDRAALMADIDRLAAVPISRHSRSEQRAYWTNLYNALTVSTVLQHYPVKSIRDIGISPGLFASGPWDAKLVRIEGTPLSLNDIEHRILRPIWQDPRIHYAVNCASLGCPNLRAEPYAAASMEAMLDAAARDYVNHSRGHHVADGRLVVSSIYVWYKSDFGGTDRGVIDHLRRYASPEKARLLDGLATISDDRYDWRLNNAVSR